MESIQMNVLERLEKGSGAAHRLRMRNQLPAVVYGHDYGSKKITIDQKELNQIVRKHGIHTFLQLQLNNETQYCMIKEIQRDPVSGSVMHVDFEAVDAQGTVRTNIPILLAGQEYAEDNGAVLQRQLGEITVEGKPHALPKFVQANVAQLNLGESLKVADLEVAEELSVLTDLDEVIATLTVVRVDPADAEEVKVIGKVNHIEEDSNVKKAKETREE